MNENHSSFRIYPNGGLKLSGTFRLLKDRMLDAYQLNYALDRNDISSTMIL